MLLDKNLQSSGEFYFKPNDIYTKFIRTITIIDYIITQNIPMLITDEPKNNSLILVI